MQVVVYLTSSRPIAAMNWNTITGSFTADDLSEKSRIHPDLIAQHGWKMDDDRSRHVEINRTDHPGFQLRLICFGGSPYYHYRYGIFFEPDDGMYIGCRSRVDNSRPGEGGKGFSKAELMFNPRDINSTVTIVDIDSSDADSADESTIRDAAQERLETYIANRMDGNEVADWVTKVRMDQASRAKMDCMIDGSEYTITISVEEDH